MHRFFLAPEQSRGPHLTLEGREAHHALHVLRLKSGDLVSVLNGAGEERLCRVGGTSRHAVDLSVEQTRFTPPSDFQITLLQAIPKGKAWENILQKATELGAHRIIPLVTERVVVHTEDNKVEKWQWIAIDSIKQCGNPWLPHIDPPRALAEILKSSSRFDVSLVASLAPGAGSPRAFLQNPVRTVAAWIGPEGDFTPEETEKIIAHGVRPITLGPRVLRADTAAISCLSIINYELLRERS